MTKPKDNLATSNCDKKKGKKNLNKCSKCKNLDKEKSDENWIVCKVFDKDFLLSLDSNKCKSFKNVDDNIQQEKGLDKGDIVKEKKCTAKQEAYARQYLVARCKASAYRYAYDCDNMSEPVIYNKAVEVYNTPCVYARIMELQEESNQRIEITVDKIQQELAKLAFTDLPGIANYNGYTMTVTEFNDLSAAQRSCIKEFEVVQSRQLDPEHPDSAKEVEKIKVKVYNKHAALVTLGKNNDMFIDRSELKVLGHNMNFSGEDKGVL